MNDATMPFRGRVVLITGGLGFIGSAVARTMATLGAEVRVLDSLLPQGGGTPRNLERLAGEVDVTIEDTRSRDVVNRVVEGVDMVVHLAGHDGISALAQDWYSEVDIGCLGTLNVLEAMRVHAPKAHMLFASSLAVYGRARSERVTEDCPTEPSSLFGVHKLTAEKYCGVYLREYGVKTTIARLATVFGPRQRVRSAGSNTLAYVLDASLHDEALRLPYGGQQLLDVVYVDDAVAVIIALLADAARAPAIINVGRGEALSLRTLAETVIAVTGRGSIVPHIDDGSRVPIEGVVADTSRLHSLGIAPPLRPLRASLGETLQWYRGRG